LLDAVDGCRRWGLSGSMAAVARMQWLVFEACSDALAKAVI